MKIAIYGAWNPEKHKEDEGYYLHCSREEFSAACKQLGNKLANLGQQLVVCTADPTTADRWVLDGYLEVARFRKDLHGRLRVLVMEAERDMRISLHQLAKGAPSGLFSFEGATVPIPMQVHLSAIAKADAVIAIAGGGGTFLAASAALLSGKRLALITSFGGSTLEFFGKVVSQLRPEQQVLQGQLGAPWNPNMVDTVSKVLGLERKVRVALIHGRSEDWRELKDWLQNKLGLPEPVLMVQNFGEGRTLVEKWEEVAGGAEAAIALVTPDDLGRLQGEKEEPRARQNVWLEFGWFWGRLGRDRILMLVKGQVVNPSDVQGYEYAQYTTHPMEAGEKIREFVEWVSRDT